jgi:hypothetical protein
VSKGTNILTLKIERNNLLCKFVFTQKPAWCPNAEHIVNVECGENLELFYFRCADGKSYPITGLDRRAAWVGGFYNF